MIRIPRLKQLKSEFLEFVSLNTLIRWHVLGRLWTSHLFKAKTSLSVFMQLIALFTVHFTASSTKKLLWTPVCLTLLLEPDHPMSRSYGKIACYLVIRLRHKVHTPRGQMEVEQAKATLFLSFPWVWLCSLSKCSFLHFYMHLHQARSACSALPEHRCYWGCGSDLRRYQLQSRLAGNFCLNLQC